MPTQRTSAFWALLFARSFRFDELEPAFRMMDTKEDGNIKPLIRFA